MTVQYSSLLGRDPFSLRYVFEGDGSLKTSGYVELFGILNNVPEGRNHQHHS
jgi:hypothetical protein